MKTLLPWLCVVGLVIGLGWVYSASRQKDAELAALREESQQLQQLRAELEATNSTSTQSQSDELARLRKDNDDLLRLRNEVSQLRKEKQQLAAQVQQAEAQTQAQFQAQRVNPAQTPAPAQPGAARAAATPQATEQQQAAICINNLRLIDGAKEQWALEKQKPRGALLTVADLAPYLKTNTLPTCPAGGVYTINPVGYAPICNFPGHALGK
jgi:TolA-binding protein